MFDNKIILITGGTGSFGNAFLNRFLNKKIKEIRIFSRDEKKQHDLRNKLNTDKVTFFIGDIRNYDSINLAMKGVDFVFHAAALKQVPSCEFFPIEATNTNVIGTNNLIDSALFNSVKKVIFLSTDKAVYPINAMGITKALMEKVIISRSRNLSSKETKLCIIRYGNVMTSRGSVIPFFINQIINNEDITVTDPNMTRFLMSLEEAIDLVIYAFKNGSQGDLFIQKASASKIQDLAIALKEIFQANNNIKVIGTRHGEKLYESLCSREEMINSVNYKNYYKIPPDNRNLNYKNYFDTGKYVNEETTDYNSHNTNRLNIDQLKDKLLSTNYVSDQLLKWKKNIK